jgi:hypothetical protein
MGLLMRAGADAGGELKVKEKDKNPNNREGERHVAMHHCAISTRCFAMQGKNPRKSEKMQIKQNIQSDGIGDPRKSNALGDAQILESENSASSRSSRSRSPLAVGWK